MGYLLCFSFLVHLIVLSDGLPLHHSPEEPVVSEMVRVRRQAGYVYDKPSVSFDLPTRAPTSAVTTQAPTVDRTQAQMMYYAYPAPSPRGNAVSTGASAGASSGSVAATSSAGSSAGYNYGAQASPESRTSATQVTSAGTSSGSDGSNTAGYGYNTPSGGSSSSAGSGQSGGGSSGYGYNAPSPPADVSSLYQSPSANSANTNDVGSSVIGTNPISDTGYAYNMPQSNPVTSTGTAVPTSAPKYLPPVTGGGTSNGINTGSYSAGAGVDGAVPSSPAAQPLDQYLPPLTIPNPATQPSDQYLPPKSSVNQSGRGSQGTNGVSADNNVPPSTNYIPPGAPGGGQASSGSTAPRPFSPAQPSSAYLPPVESSKPAPSIPSTPGPTYLPPVF